MKKPIEPPGWVLHVMKDGVMIDTVFSTKAKRDAAAAKYRRANLGRPVYCTQTRRTA